MKRTSDERKLASLEKTLASSRAQLKQTRGLGGLTLGMRVRELERRIERMRGKKK